MCQRADLPNRLSNHRTHFFRPVRSRVHCDQRGAGYTLSYVLTMPFYLMLVCMIVETPLVLLAKLGTVRAASAAARSAAVYASTAEWTEAEKRALRAAQQAMTPLASGVQGPRHLVGGSDGLIEYVAAYTARNAGLEGTKYVAGKYSYAQNAVSLSLGDRPQDWNAPIAATVTYEFPFHVPGVGRLFGQPRPLGVYVLPIKTTVSITNEGPQNEDQDLGIGYGKQPGP